MPQPKSRTQREAKFMEAARQMYAELEDWYAQHPDASFGEIETEARRRRRELMGQVLKILINERDTGYQLKSPACPSCGQPMKFERYRAWRVNGLEGDTDLERAYYVCPKCKGQTLFPPRSETPTAGGSLE
jgi:hypothetical protein